MCKVQYYFSDTTSSTKRLWVNYTDEDLYGERSTLLDRFYALDAISCWGGKDKQDECRDGSTTVSWELPAEFVPTVERMLIAFKGERWKQSNFWQEGGKQ
jgi:hypothetical protein